MEANTLHCQSCGASVGENDLQCPYCKSQLATVACPRCFGMVGIHASHCPRCGAAIVRVEEAATSLVCPGCSAALVTTAVGGVGLDQCHACGGLWVSQANFARIAADRAERGEVLSGLPGAGTRVPLRLEAVHYRPCPQCRQLMNRVNYGRISGVVLDVCKEHGLWFPRDEFRQVLEFIEGGGLEKSRARQVQEEAEQRRQPAAPIPSGAWAETAEEGGGGLLSAFEDLLHLIRRS
jgi:Zn-finger nucleic acid-binding protein/RNA polymerase subunit RPABC4/transcription elongation factor Spt4